MSDFKQMKFEFSFWAAKRAVQSARVKSIFATLSDDQKLKFENKLQNIDVTDYKKWHDETCSILNNNIPYGVKAKFIALFVKTYYVLGNYNIYKKIVFPPIDSRTIEALNNKIKLTNKINLKKYKWSKIDRKDFYYLLNLIEKNYNYIYKIEEEWKDSDRYK